MLKNLLCGVNQSHIVMLEDSLSCSGRRLWQKFIQQMTLSGHYVVHVFYYENPMQTIANCESANIKLHDCFSNPRGWISGKGDDCGLLKTVKKAVGVNSGEVVIAIDSLSPLIFNYGIVQCYRALHTLMFKTLISGVTIKQIICLIHEDFLPDRDHTISRLQHLASTYLQVEAPLKVYPQYPTVRITYKKPGGKVIKKHEYFYFDGDGQVNSSDVQQSPEIPVSVANPATSMDELTTFKLGLRQEEMKARSQLVLPYLKTEEKKDCGGGGKVFYQPDAADDWDEEDPDDDLDI